MEVIRRLLERLGRRWFEDPGAAPAGILCFAQRSPDRELTTAILKTWLYGWCTSSRFDHPVDPCRLCGVGGGDKQAHCPCRMARSRQTRCWCPSKRPSTTRTPSKQHDLYKRKSSRHEKHDYESLCPKRRRSATDLHCRGNVAGHGSRKQRDCLDDRMGVQQEAPKCPRVTLSDCERELWGTERQDTIARTSCNRATTQTQA